MGKQKQFLLTNLFVLLLMWSLSCDTVLAASANGMPTTSMPQFGAYRPSGKSPYNPRSHKNKGIQHTVTKPLKMIKGGPEFWGVIEYSDKWESTYANESEWPVGIYSFLAGGVSKCTPPTNWQHRQI